MKVLSKPKTCGQDFTLDISTADTHTYQLANGCVTHNTASLILGTSSGVH